MNVICDIFELLWEELVGESGEEHLLFIWVNDVDEYFMSFVGKLCFKASNSSEDICHQTFRIILYKGSKHDNYEYVLNNQNKSNRSNLGSMVSFSVFFHSWSINLLIFTS